ncbi:MAG: hypothetical protein WBN85_05805 [Candidatus Macondimonas sp.]
MAQIIPTRALGAAVVVFSVGLGGWAMKELEHYLSVTCLARGECYGRMDWVYWVTLVPPLTLAGALASLLVILFALAASSRFSLRMMGQGAMPDVETTQSVRHLSHSLAGVGALALMLFAGVAVWFTQL